MSGTVSSEAAPPLTDIYDSSQLIRKKNSSSSFTDSEEDNNPLEEAPVPSPLDAKVYASKPTTPTRAFLNSSFSHSNTLLSSPTTRKPTLPTSPQQYSSMVRQQSANIHSIFNKLNTLNEKTRHEDKRSFLHSIKGHMRKSSKDKFSSLFDPFEGSPLGDTWRGSPLQPFSPEDAHRSPITSPHSPLKSPTLTSYPTFTKLTSHSKRRFTHDNTVEELAREMEQYYLQNNQKIEGYIDQIATLEKQKRDAVVESKHWKKQCIYAENKLHSQELEFQEEIRNLNEQHQKDLETIKGIHRKKCKQYGEIIKKLMATNEAFRAQLQECGIVPVTANPEAEILVETQEWAEDREFIRQKLAAIEQRRLASRSEEEMAASIEYITLALGMELRQKQVKKFQTTPETTSTSSPITQPIELTAFSRKRPSLRGARENRPENYFSLRIGKERRKDIEKVTSIYHKTDHRKLNDDLLKASQTAGINQFSDDSDSSADEASIPLQFVTTSRGPLDRRTKSSLGSSYSSKQTSTNSMSSASNQIQEDRMITFQFKPSEETLKPWNHHLDEEKDGQLTPYADAQEKEGSDVLSTPDLHSHEEDVLHKTNTGTKTDDGSTTIQSYEYRLLASHDTDLKETSNCISPFSPKSRTSTCNVTSRVSPNLSVFAKNRNPICSVSPCQKSTNRSSTLNYSPSSGHVSTTPEHSLALRKKPLPKIPEMKSLTGAVLNVQTNQETL